MVTRDVFPIADLQEFLAVYPEMAKRPFYLAGESYAGHYVPTFATKILEENAKNSSGAVRINLKVSEDLAKGLLRALKGLKRLDPKEGP